MQASLAIVAGGLGLTDKRLALDTWCCPDPGQLALYTSWHHADVEQAEGHRSRGSGTYFTRDDRKLGDACTQLGQVSASLLRSLIYGRLLEAVSVPRTNQGTIRAAQTKKRHSHCQSCCESEGFRSS